MSTKVSQTLGQGAFPVSSFKYDPLIQVRAVYIQFIQYLFYQAPVGHYHWDPDPALSEIVVTAENPVDLEVVNKRPFITFARGPIAFSSLGFDDMHEFNFESGAKKKSVIVPGTMSINVCSRNDLESESLAWIVMEHVWLLRDQLMQSGFLDIGRNMQMGPPSRAGAIVPGDAGREWYCTTLLSPFTFHRTSQITPLNKPVVEDIETELTTNLQAIPEASVPSTEGRPDLPYNVGHFHEGASTELSELKKVPHPLNPTQLVTVRSSRPNTPAVKPPMFGGRLLITKGPVEQSPENSGTTIVVKV